MINIKVKSAGRGKVEYPANHKPGMKIPKGGSMCANCRFFDGNDSCKNEYFIKWNGAGKLPAPADEYCSDWYEPK